MSDNNYRIDEKVEKFVREAFEKNGGTYNFGGKVISITYPSMSETEFDEEFDEGNY